MLTEIDTVKIPIWALPALINGDYSGLTDLEENLIEDFLRVYDDYEGLVFEPDHESYFAMTNDVIFQGGEVYDVTIYGHLVEVDDDTRSFGPRG